VKKADSARIERFIAPYRVTSGRGFRLKSFNPADTAHLDSASKAEARRLLARSVDWLAEQQEMLYAQDHWAVLLVFQAMDAAGKDSTIKHVMSGINPQGCQVTSYKQPSSEELDHDYLWRYMRNVPARGQIGIFNRSYYEEVLVVKVHREHLRRQKLHSSLVTRKIWQERYEDITSYERYLNRNGVVTLKFFLNVSKDEQRQRFMKRLDEPRKNWKLSLADIDERGHWDAYQSAYADAIRHTATDWAPWYVVPADNKWFARLVVAVAVVDVIARLKLHYPRLDAAQRNALAVARRRLDNE
jgi:PPK2 family polyphosphate:nucleotide phosphotransferase